MDWALLLVSGVMEAVWAIALDKSQGFTQMVPTIVFIVFYIASVVGLGFSMKTLPVGTAYVVWGGIGTGITVVYSMMSGAESASLIKIALLVIIAVCVAGLKLVSD